MVIKDLKAIKEYKDKKVHKVIKVKEVNKVTKVIKDSKPEVAVAALRMNLASAGVQANTVVADSKPAKISFADYMANR